MRASAVSCLTLVLLAACGTPSAVPEAKSDWEKANEEKLAASERAAAANAVPTPPVQRGELIEFAVTGTSEFRFFVDASTLSVDNEGIVRYVLVARSSSGTENVSFEGMRCDTRERKVYALGHSDGSWARARDPKWQRIELRDLTPYYYVLYREYFCASRTRPATPKQAVEALKWGVGPGSTISD